MCVVPYAVHDQSAATITAKMISAVNDVRTNAFADVHFVHFDLSAKLRVATTHPRSISITYARLNVHKFPLVASEHCV